MCEYYVTVQSEGKKLLRMEKHMEHEKETDPLRLLLHRSWRSDLLKLNSELEGRQEQPPGSSNR